MKDLIKDIIVFYNKLFEYGSEVIKVLLAIIVIITIVMDSIILILSNIDLIFIKFNLVMGTIILMPYVWHRLKGKED